MMTDPTVTDHRIPPRGVLSQNSKFYLLIGLAALVLLVIVTSGNPAPLATTASVLPSLIPNPERMKDYEARLRELASQPQPPKAVIPLPRPIAADEDRAVVAARPVDQTQEERRRKDYDSLFSSNVVISRRPEGQRLAGPAQPRQAAETAPSLDDVATSVIKAMNGGRAKAGAVAPPVAVQDVPDTAPVPRLVPPGAHRVYEGTVIDAVLANRLEGSLAGPVNCLISTPVYSQDLVMVIPAGARVLGTAKPVQSFGDERLAVGFHRIVFPDGRDVRLEQFPGANQVGDIGLKDKVNHHYWAAFGAAGAVGLISGFAQWVGGGFSNGNNRSTVVYGGGADAVSQIASQTMSRFLNRLPTVTIREGHRVKVYLTSDLDLLPYRSQP